MKYLALVGLLSFALACGGVVDDSKMATPPPQGPGTVAAADGVSIAYTVSGSGSPALVFIHGWMCNQGFWSEQIGDFSTRNTVVTIDLPGHGQSGMDRDDWPLAAYGADVAAVVKHLDLSDVVLIGHSMGGPVALEAARLMPKRTAGVVAADSLHDADATYDPEHMKGILEMFENDFEKTCGQFSASMFSRDADPALVERVTSEMCSGSPEVAIALMGQFDDFDMGAALSAVEVPVRYVNSDSSPTNIKVNRRYQPNFDGMIMHDVGHFLMMEDPGHFNELLQQVINMLDEPAM